MQLRGRRLSCNIYTIRQRWPVSAQGLSKITSAIASRSRFLFPDDVEMPRRLFKKIQKRMPDKGKLSTEWYLRPFNALLHDPGLWSVHRRGVTKAVAIGLFFAMLPIVGQMALAALVALWVRVNLPVAVAFTWVSNPLTYVPIYYPSYKLGALLLGVPRHDSGDIPVSIDWIASELATIWKPLFLGSGLVAVVVAAIGFTALNLTWRLAALNRLKRRRRRAAG